MTCRSVNGNGLSTAPSAANIRLQLLLSLRRHLLQPRAAAASVPCRLQTYLPILCGSDCSAPAPRLYLPARPLPPLQTTPPPLVPFIIQSVAAPDGAALSGLLQLRCFLCWTYTAFLCCILIDTKWRARADQLSTSSVLLISTVIVATHHSEGSMCVISKVFRRRRRVFCAQA